MNCVNCGNPLPEGTKFCTFCGTKVVAPVAAAMQEALNEPVTPEAPAFESAPAFQEAPAVETFAPEAPAFEAPVEEVPVNEVPQEEAPAPSFEPTAFAAAPFEQAPAQGFQPQTQGFQPQAQGFQPQDQGFQPQPQGFQPQPQGFQPQAQGFQPQDQGFQPQGFQPQGFQPQPQGFQPQGQGFQPQGFQPQPQGFQPQPPTQPKKKKKTGLIIGIILGALALVGIVIALIMILGKPKDPDPVNINLNDYVTVEFEGYDGVGTVSKEEFDSEGLYEDFADMIQWTNAAKKNYKSMVESYDSAADFALDYLYGYVEYTDNYFSLKNGDTVKWVWTSIDTEFISTLTNAVIIYEDFDITVTGLEEVKTFDPFEGLEVTFTGTSGSGYAEIVQTKTEEPYASLYYWIDNNWDLKNGDEVRIYIEEYEDNDLRDSYGMVPSTHEMFVTVEGLAFYVTDIADVPEDVISDMTSFFIDNLTTEIIDAKINDVTDPSVTYYGAYLASLKEDAYNIDKNRIYLVFTVNFKANGTNVTYYYYTLYTDLFVDEEGVFSYYEDTVDNYDVPPVTFTYKFKDKDDKEVSITIRGYQTLDELDTAVRADCVDFDFTHEP